MKKGLVLFSLLLVLSILAIVPYMRYTKKKRIVNYLNTYHPELMYEIESFERDTFYYRDIEEIRDLYRYYNTPLEMLYAGYYEDESFDTYAERVNELIQRIDSVHIRPYYIYITTGDASKMDRGANAIYGYTVKLKTPVGYYYMGIFESNKTKYLFYDTRKYSHRIEEELTEYEVFNERIKNLYRNSPKYPHRIKEDSINNKLINDTIN